MFKKGDTNFKCVNFLNISLNNLENPYTSLR